MKEEVLDGPYVLERLWAKEILLQIDFDRVRKFLLRRFADDEAFPVFFLRNMLRILSQLIPKHQGFLKRFLLANGNQPFANRFLKHDLVNHDFVLIDPINAFSKTPVPSSAFLER